MTSIFDHEVGTDEQGTRLDAFVAGLGIDELASRSAAVRLIESGRILVNDQPTTKKRIVIAGDMVHIEIPPRSGETLISRPPTTYRSTSATRTSILSCSPSSPASSAIPRADITATRS